MKTRYAVLLVSLLSMSIPAVHDAAAYHDYSAQFDVRATSDFYEPLAPFGRWVEIQPYGWCWYPAYVARDWRPYTSGYWLWTDGGWYWVSEEPWAWACYHYGRWVWDTYYGWVWVPGLEWAPAWVCWREGGGYIGWAPLPPECDFSPYGNVIYADRVVIAPIAFVFVEVRRFCEPIRPSIIVINQTIVHNTVNITNIRRVNNTVINEGPRTDVIQRANPRPLPVGSVSDLRPAVPRPRPQENRPVPQRSPQPFRDVDREIPVRKNMERVRDSNPVIVRGASVEPGMPVRVRRGSVMPPVESPRIENARPPAAVPATVSREARVARRMAQAPVQSAQAPAAVETQPAAARSDLPAQASSGTGRKLGFVR